MKKYYPKTNNPLHAVQDWAKVRKMIRHLRVGGVLPPVYMDGELGCSNWLSGTHRVAASEIRALLDGNITDYSDLTLIDISEFLSEMTEEKKEEWTDLFDRDSERACEILDNQYNPGPAGKGN